MAQTVPVISLSLVVYQNVEEDCWRWGIINGGMHRGGMTDRIGKVDRECELLDWQPVIAEMRSVFYAVVEDLCGRQLSLVEHFEAP